MGLGGERCGESNSKGEEVLKHMDMTLVNAIRKLGWPDANGHLRYGNAAILCYLNHPSNPVVRFVEECKDMQISELIAKYA